MRPLPLTLLFALLLPQAASAQPSAQPSAGCLDGICINASVETIPAPIPWRPVPVEQRRSFVDPRYADASNRADAKNNVERGAAYALSIYPEVGNVASDVGDLMNRDRGSFDAKALGMLKTLKATCRPFAWVGEYASASGFTTEVTLMLYPAGSGTEGMRVHRITRIYPQIAIGDEFQDLRQKVQDLINMPVNDKARSAADRAPIAMMSRSPAKGSATLDIQVTPPGMFDTRTFGKDAACKNRVSAQ